MGAVLGLAVTALVVDKVFLGGGATPSLAADGTSAPGTPAAGGTTGGIARTVDGTPTDSVTAQLRAMAGRLDLDSGPQLADAFAPPRALAEFAEQDAARRKVQERQSLAAEQAGRLRDRLRLTATRTTGLGLAMINGTLYSLGDEVPETGHRVKEIDREGVVLEDTVSLATFRLDLKPEGGGTGYRPGKSN